jgi:nicotinamidase-related amidase
VFALRPEPSTAPRHLVCLDLVRSETRLDGCDHPGLARRITVCRRLLQHARWRDWEITHVHPRSASRASRPVDGLEPLPSERLVYRTGVSAFSNRAFRQAVKAQPEAELVIAGFSLSSSCLATALTAHDWGLTVVLISDAVLGEGEQPLRSVVAPFVRIAAADDLIEVRRGLRLIASVQP